MASRELERIRGAVLDGKYTVSEHAYDEMEDDNLDVLDMESAILTGVIDQRLTKDPARDSLCDNREGYRSCDARWRSGSICKPR